jgi:hypothetical protein
VDTPAPEIIHAYYSKYQERLTGEVAVYETPEGGELRCTEVSSLPPALHEGPEDQVRVGLVLRGRMLRKEVTDPAVAAAYRAVWGGLGRREGALPRIDAALLSITLQQAGTEAGAAMKAAARGLLSAGN